VVVDADVVLIFRRHVAVGVQDVHQQNRRCLPHPWR
jgi:hypothetical protein